MQQILVTGGLGFIGSHTVVELQQAGFEVIVVDNLSNADRETLNRIEKITGIKPHFYAYDLQDEIFVHRLAADFPNLTTIVHFAAHKAVGESVQKPLMYYRNNVGSLINILQAFGGRKLNLVFSSSCTVYGQPDTLPVDEQAPTRRPESPYGNTKRVCEEILEDICKTSDIHNISLRYFNPIGAHKSALIGELPSGIPNNLLPYITQTAKGIREKLTIYGNDYDTKDGTCVRDYIHVVDLAKAHVAAVNRLLTNKNIEKYEVYNIGTGTGYTVLEVIEAFEKANGIKLNYIIGARREGDIEKVYGNVKKAADKLGWKAELDLHEMVRSAWAWEKTL